MDETNNSYTRERPIYEKDKAADQPDPNETPIQDRRLVTNPYDIVIESLLNQINNGTLHLRPLSDRPKFQRRYVWNNRLASKFIESILLNVPIPPCYLSQNEDFELDVIDGQQRIYSIYRFVENQFKLKDLQVLQEDNNKYFYELPKNLKRKLNTYTLRCVIISNDSDPEIRFDVFERLNTNTMPLNAQELRNCIYRGPLIDLVSELAEHPLWLNILNRKAPDNRMRGEELILRFFAFAAHGIKTYRTPQKHWLNDFARGGMHYNDDKINELRKLWLDSIEKSIILFSPEECFRRLPLPDKKTTINRALMDLTMNSVSRLSFDDVKKIRTQFRKNYINVLKDAEFDDLISRSVDHKSRTVERFNIWHREVMKDLLNA